jgi:hypothetical protein
MIEVRDMDADEYRRLSSQPAVMTRKDIEESAWYVGCREPVMEIRMRRILWSTSPIGKSPHERDGGDSELFRVKLSAFDLEQIVDALLVMEVGAADPERDRVSRLFDIWNACPPCEEAADGV